MAKNYRRKECGFGAEKEARKDLLHEIYSLAERGFRENFIDENVYT